MEKKMGPSNLYKEVPTANAVDSGTAENLHLVGHHVDPEVPMADAVDLGAAENLQSVGHHVDPATMEAEDPDYSSEQDEDYAQCLESALVEPELEIRDDVLHYFVPPTPATESNTTELEEEDDSLYDINRFLILPMEEVPAATPLSTEAEPHIDYGKSISSYITRVSSKT
jgi:hypothetical protein